MSIDTRVAADEVRRVYSDEDFERDWEDGVPADTMAARAGRGLQWVYQKRKRLDLEPRDPVPYDDPQVVG